METNDFPFSAGAPVALFDVNIYSSFRLPINKKVTPLHRNHSECEPSQRALLFFVLLTFVEKRWRPLPLPPDGMAPRPRETAPREPLPTSGCTRKWMSSMVQFSQDAY